MGRIGVSTERALGLRVTRASATLPQSTAAPIFNIVNDRVALVIITGEVTVQIQSVGGQNLAKVVANPTVGTVQDICTALDIDGDIVGSLYGITGTFTDPLSNNDGALSGQTARIVLKPGTLDLDCSANRTGEIKWSIIYIPLAVDAAIIAA